MRNYTHKTADGSLWRFVGSRPISAYDDYIMDLAKEDKKRKSKKKKNGTQRSKK